MTYHTYYTANADTEKLVKNYIEVMLRTLDVEYELQLQQMIEKSENDCDTAITELNQQLENDCKLCTAKYAAMEEQANKAALDKINQLHHKIEVEQANIDGINEARNAFPANVDTSRLDTLVCQHQFMTAKLQAAIEDTQTTLQSIVKNCQQSCKKELSDLDASHKSDLAAQINKLKQNIADCQSKLDPEIKDYFKAFLFKALPSNAAPEPKKQINSEYLYDYLTPRQNIGSKESKVSNAMQRLALIHSLPLPSDETSRCRYLLFRLCFAACLSHYGLLTSSELQEFLSYLKTDEGFDINTSWKTAGAFFATPFLTVFHATAVVTKHVSRVLQPFFYVSVVPKLLASYIEKPLKDSRDSAAHIAAGSYYAAKGCLTVDHLIELIQNKIMDHFTNQTHSKIDSLMANFPTQTEQSPCLELDITNDDRHSIPCPDSQRQLTIEDNEDTVMVSWQPAAPAPQ